MLVCSHLPTSPGQCITPLAELGISNQVYLYFLMQVDAFQENASLECIPDNIDVLEKESVYKVDINRHRAIDSMPWKPELPNMIGLYHAYTRGFNKDAREHKLFVLCSGGCVNASDNYYNLMLDVGDKTDVDDLYDSQETWWLRKVAYRSRCRLIKMLADKFGLSIRTVPDVNSYDPQDMAVSTIDTVYHDIQRLKSGHISVFSDCCDPTVSRNGILCVMNPSEGVWLFKGPPNQSLGFQTYGGIFGSQSVCGAFPCNTFSMPYNTANKKTLNYTHIVRKDPPNVVRINENDNTRRQYQVFDERFMKNLEKMQWNRDNGVVELMPIVVGLK